MASSTISPVTGSNLEIFSIVSPHHSIAVAGLVVRREDLERVALHAERAAGPAHVVARVLDVDEPLHRELERDLGALVRPEDLPLVLLGRAEPVDARDARHDQHVARARAARPWPSAAAARSRR